MSTLTITICDMCDDQAPLTKPFHVVADSVELDLCPRHAQRWKGLPRARTRPAAAPKTRAGKAGSRTLVKAKSRGSATTGSGRARTTGANGKPVGRPAARPAGKGAKKAVSAPATKRTPRPPVDNSAVRAWARSNGIAVPSRGPLKTDVIEQFLAAPVNNIKPRGGKQPDAMFSHKG